MLESVYLYNKELIVDICKRNIFTPDMFLVSFLNLIEEKKIIETTDNLLERLGGKNYPFEIFHLTKTLLSFKNLETNKKVTNILIAKRDDWDRGNWSEGFRELFKENDIRIE